VPPWEVANITFDAERHRLDIQLSFERGARFACPEGDRDDGPVHDLVRYDVLRWLRTQISIGVLEAIKGRFRRLIDELAATGLTATTSR
jgi:hypothetical protein